MGNLKRRIIRIIQHINDIHLLEIIDMHIRCILRTK